MKILNHRVFVSVTVILALAVTFAVSAQTSTNYQNKEHVVNAGGNPAPALTSTSYSITLSSIGDGLTGTGMTSTSYQIDGGFVPAFPAPGEVQDLRFTAKTAFGWTPEPSVGTYSVYKATIADLLGGSYGTCFDSGLTSPSVTDTATPAAGQCFFYLVTAKNRLGEEGPMGNNSSGAERTNASPCS